MLNVPMPVMPRKEAKRLRMAQAETERMRPKRA